MTSLLSGPLVSYDLNYGLEIVTLFLKPGLGIRGDEQTLLGHHCPSLEGHHLHRLLRHRARRKRDEQGYNPLHDVTDPASQNNLVLQQRPGEGQAISGRDLDAGTGATDFLSLSLSLRLSNFYFSLLSFLFFYATLSAIGSSSNNEVV